MRFWDLVFCTVLVAQGIHATGFRCDSLSKVITLWQCVKVKQRYLWHVCMVWTSESNTKSVIFVSSRKILLKSFLTFPTRFKLFLLFSKWMIPQFNSRKPFLILFCDSLKSYAVFISFFGWFFKLQNQFFYLSSIVSGWCSKKL